MQRSPYKGKCQLSNFTFIQKNGNPYFEIHHIKENKSNYLRNLLVVSPNIHAQFTYSRKKAYFDDNGWLRKVNFNKKEFNAYQFVDEVDRRIFIREVHQLLVEAGCPLQSNAKGYSRVYFGVF